ncbi:hypothetical protein KR074_008549 [Drosophila pseudoananassae]|nr:hypothetical protein KR074_008549 [Drosophila pseudoananassae]
MQGWVLIFFGVILLSQALSAKIDYCATPYCGFRNVACHNNVSYGNCPKNLKVLKMNRYVIRFADTLNAARNKVATGKFRNLPIAARMAKVVWSEELSWFAKLMLSNCNTDTHECMSSPSFYYIGNIYEESSVPLEMITFTNFAILMGMLESWLTDIKGLSKRHTLRLPTSMNKASTLNAALVISERLTHFGCSAVTSEDSEKRDYKFMCTFATDIFPGQRLYNWGIRAGCQCKQLDKRFKGLCSSKEEYYNNKPSRFGGTMFI